jgi:CheY-like chemotaxis protein
MELELMGQSVPSEPVRKPCVLVVDNEALALHALQRMLQRDAEVVVAATFDEARRLLEGGARFDAFVFDINLDPGSGLDLLAFAREHGYATTPAIVVTGTSGNAFVNPVHALHAELLTKPFPPEQLREFVRRAGTHADDESGAGSSVPADTVTAVRVRTRVSLADCIDDLRRLFSMRQSWETWYAIGTIVREMQANLGPRAVPAAAVEIRRNRVKLYRCARVAGRWSVAEVEKLLAGTVRKSVFLDQLG